MSSRSYFWDNCEKSVASEKVTGLVCRSQTPHRRLTGNIVCVCVWWGGIAVRWGFLSCFSGDCSQPRLLLVSLRDNISSPSSVPSHLTSNVMASLCFLSEPSGEQCPFLLSATYTYSKRLSAVLSVFVCLLISFFSLTQVLFHPQCAAPCPAGDPASKGSLMPPAQVWSPVQSQNHLN